MRFHYIASQPNGKIVEGDFEAPGTTEVLIYLSNQGLRPISLKVTKGVQESGGRSFFGQTITIADKIFLTKYLSLMLKVGTDLFKAIDILINDMNKPAVKALLMEIRDALIKGQPFYSTFVKYPKYFSPVFINLVKAGEASGNLEKVFEELSVSLEKENDLRRKVKSALAYPAILVVVSFVILFLLISFALPKIAEVFMSSGIKPPTFSRIVLSIGLFVNQYLWFIIPFLIISIFGSWYLFSKTLTGKKIFQQFINKAPGVKDVIKQLAFQRFAKTLSSLLKAGLPILDALEITSQAVGSEELKNSLLRISREGIAKGLTIGEAFKREKIFPSMIVNLMTISEKAGHIEDILNTLADFYEAEAEASIKTMMTFLEPILLMIMGIVIGVIALSIILPIYQLTGQF